MYVTHQGSFRSRDGVLYIVQLLQDLSAAPTVVYLTFPADEPLSIEWSETAKTDVLCPSHATLRIVSTTDREHLGLYRTAVCDVRMQVWRAGALYWCGTLDTELYEEPYSRLSGYEVELTFSDFAVLDRLRWSPYILCRMSIASVVDHCLTRCSIRYGIIGDALTLQRHISTEVAVPAAGGLQYVNVTTEELFVNTYNFRDEDGEMMSLADVLEAVLAPLSLRIVQMAGKVYLYDINALTRLSASAVVWRGTDAALRFDKVYNRCRVTLSTYPVGSKVYEAEVQCDEDLRNAAETDTQHTELLYTSERYEGFYFQHVTDLGTNFDLVQGTHAELFQTVPVLSGQSETGIVWSMATSSATLMINFYNDRYYPIGDHNRPFFISGSQGDSEAMAWFKTSELLPYINVEGRYVLRLALQLMVDARYNPYEEADSHNEKASQDILTGDDVMLYVPCAVVLLSPAGGEVLYHYVNRGREQSVGDYKSGTWEEGDALWGECWLCYRGAGGWKTNTQLAFNQSHKVPGRYALMPDGEYIPVPPAAGIIAVTVYSGLFQYGLNNEAWRIRWVLYKDLKVELVRNVNGEALPDGDVELSAYLDQDASEELSLDLTVGTVPEEYDNPTSRCLITLEDGSVPTSFRRPNGEGYHTCSRLERLLLGTVYAQHGTRRVMLSGTAAPMLSPGPWTEAGFDGKVFLLTACRHDLAEDCEEVTLVECAPDTYVETIE
ncbi:MAG: hypothetical protein K6F98_05630 [Bacteroidales bacterium]|nr:hypothetical protein [Bacteroidales bacterium]